MTQAEIEAKEKEFKVNLDGKKVDTPVRIKIMDTKGPFRTVTYSDMAWAGASILGVILAIYFITGLIKKLRGAPKVLSPYEAAVKSIDELEKKKAPDPTSHKAHYFELSSILRSYLKAVFNMTQAELTTREFIDELSKIEAIVPEQKEELKKLLLSYNMVKFSGRAPEEGEFVVNIETVRKIVNGINKP